MTTLHPQRNQTLDSRAFHASFFRDEAVPGNYRVMPVAGCVRFQPCLCRRLSSDDFETRTLDDGLRQFLESNNAGADWPRTNWDLNALTLAAFYYHPDLT
jgi:hypothetical protein